MEVINEKVTRPPRGIIYGMEKVGKSTFCAEFPNPIFLPIKGEEGVDEIGVSRFKVSDSLEEVTERMKELCTEEHEYSTLVFDSLSSLEPLIHDFICRKYGQESIGDFKFSEGYRKANEQFYKLLNICDYLRNEKYMTIIFIGHTKIDSINDPTGDSYNTYNIDCNKYINATIQRWADFIFFARFKTLTKSTDSGRSQSKTKAFKQDRILSCSSNGSFTAGGRDIYGNLPLDIELSYSVFQDELKKAGGKNDW